MPQTQAHPAGHWRGMHLISTHPFYLTFKHKTQSNLLIIGLLKVVWPYDWSPKIVETQILRIGQLMIIGYDNYDFEFFLSENLIKYMYQIE